MPSHFDYITVLTPQSIANTMKPIWKMGLTLCAGAIVTSNLFAQQSISVPVSKGIPVQTRESSQLFGNPEHGAQRTNGDGLDGMRLRRATAAAPRVADRDVFHPPLRCALRSNRPELLRCMPAVHHRN